MLRLPIALLVAVVLLSTGVRARAAIINTSMVIDASNSFPGQTVEVVDGANPPTVVDVVAGAVIGGWQTYPDIVARGQSVVRLWDGGILKNDYDASARLYGQSRMQVYGDYGYWQWLGVGLQDSARLDLVPGSSIGGASADGTSFLRAENCKIETVTTYGNATARLINVEGVDERTHITSRGNSVVKITGGTLEWIFARDDSTIWHNGGGLIPGATDRSNFHWVGGRRFAEAFFVTGDATLHVYGYDMAYTFYDDGEPPAVHGYRKDGTGFYNPVILRDNGRIVFHTIPEPANGAILALGVLAITTFRRRFASR
jgi:hypothetical protein